MAAAVPFLVVGAVGLIGEWLLGPKSSATSSDQPQSMPSMNQALRGTPLFISFGTVRVSAQIIWTKNWTAVRQQGGGKGAAKGGGSGGGGSAKGAGSGGSGYVYTWDLIYHFGMVDTPSVITKAWIGSDVVKGATVLGWNSDFPAVDTLISNVAGTADMQATEAFYQPGYPTGDSHLTAWPYFNSQEGVAPAWPSTCWLGFNQLQLGTTPSVPQLSVELTPAEAASDFTPIGLTFFQHPNSSQDQPSGASIMQSEGRLYSFTGDGSDAGFNINDVAAETNTNLSDTQANIDAATFMSGTIDHQGIIPIPYSPYLYSLFLVDSLTTPAYGLALYKIVDGTPTFVGSYQMLIHDGHNVGPNGPVSVGRLPDNRVAIMFTGRSLAATFTGMMALPDPATVDGNTLTVAVEWSEVVFDLGLGNDLIGNVNNESQRPVAQAIFVPNGSDDTVRVVMYFDKSRIDEEQSIEKNTFVHDTGITYPNGFTASIDWDGGGGTGSSWGINDFFKDAAGGSAVPWPDVQLDSTGAAGDYYDDYFMATTSTGTVLVGRQYSDIRNRGHFYVYNGDGTYQFDFKEDFGSATDWPSGVGANSNQMRLLNMFQDPASGIIWFMATRLNTAANENTKYVEFGALNPGFDLTPPEIIYKVLTSDIYGFNTAALFGFTITTDVIDATSYADAVQKCKDEGIKISVSYTNQDALLTIINDLLGLYGGTLAEANGTIFFDVYRATDVPIRTIDNHHLIRTDDGAAPVNVTKGAIQDGYNSVQYQFLDRSIDYKQNQITVTDEVDIDINGYRNKTYQSQFVMTGSLASLVGERALWSNMYGRDNYAFTLGWKDADLRPGNQVTLVDSFHPSLSKGVKVVINNKNESDRGKFSITATRVFDNHLTAQHGYTNTASISGGIDDILQTAGPMINQLAYELPQEFQGATGYVYFSYNMSTYLMGAQLYISRDLGANYVLTQDVQPFVLGGRFNQPLPKRRPGEFDTDVEFWLLPKDDFDVSSPAFIANETLDDATASLRQGGLSTLVVGSEALAMEGLTLLGQNHYRIDRLYRGWGGTPIAAIASGAYFVEHGPGMFAFPITQDDIGNKLFYKISGYNFSGRVYDVSSVEPKQWTVKGDRWLPRAQPPITTFVSSALAWPGTDPFKGDAISTAAGGGTVTLAWRDASNTEGFGAGGFGNGGAGHFAVDDTNTPSYRIDVASKNGTPVSSFVVTTRSFGYTAAQNSADFAGAGHDLIFTVTPFNVKGDGPTSYSRSLSLIW